MIFYVATVAVVGTTLLVAGAAAQAYRSLNYKNLNEEQRGEFWADTTLLVVGAGFAASGVRVASRNNIKDAEAARDALVVAIRERNTYYPAAVCGGKNTKTGEVLARASGNGKCAEQNVVDALGGNKNDVILTGAIRPKKVSVVPVCNKCEAEFGRDKFPGGTIFKSDIKPDEAR